jgi:glycosyltransferase involved in cell wall biosynthesis
VDDIGKASFKKLFYLLKIIINLIQKLFSRRIDLVYFTLSPTGFAFYRDILLVAILKIFRKKIVYHLHGKGIRENVLKSRIDKFLYAFVFKNTQVITLSKILNKDIELIYKGTPYVLNNGIISQEIVEYKNIQEKPITFVFLSNLVLSKGIKTLLDAIKITHDNGYEFRVKIIGNSVDYSIDEAQAFVRSNNLSAIVNVLGPKYGMEKSKELSECDVFVFPTENDCFPLCLLEAMQMQLPIISTSNGAIPDIVEDGVNGFIVDEGSPKQVSEAMISYIKDKYLLNQHGINNLEKFKKNYTQQLFEKNFVSVIQLVLLNKSNSG